MAVVLLGTARQVFGIPWPVAPQNSAHTINKTYGDWNGDRFYIDSLGCHIAYHTAVDIPADSGTAVLAVFDGYVTDAQTFTGNQVHMSYITIARTWRGNPAWHYGHVIPHPDLGRDSTVSNTDTLGWVAKFGNGTNNHLHFYLEEEVGILTRSVCNPLDSLAPAPSQDAQFAPRPPVGRHGFEIDYVKDRRETIQLAQTLWDASMQEYLLKDSIDVVVGAIAVTEGNYDPGIYGLGYSVSPVDSGGTTPYRSMLMMRGPFEMADSLAYYATFVDPETWPADWPLSRYIVTNCGDSIPSVTKGISNIEEHCWPTRVDTSGTGVATRNEEARWPDGWYDVFLKAWSHSGDTAAVHDTVFVGNFAPPVNRALVRQTSGSRDSTVVYDAHWEGDELQVETDEPVRLMPGDVLEVELLFSEGMHDTIRVTLEGPYAGLPFETVRWDSVVHPRDRWVGRYPLTTWDSVRNLMAGDRRLVIWAEDAVTRNALDSNPATAAYWDAEAEEWVGYEGDDGLPGQTGGHDRVHRLQIEPWVDLAIAGDLSGSVCRMWAAGAINVPHHLLDLMRAAHDSVGRADRYRASLHRYWAAPGTQSTTVQLLHDVSSNLASVQTALTSLYQSAGANWCSNQLAPREELQAYTEGMYSRPRRLLFMSDLQVNSGPYVQTQVAGWTVAGADTTWGTSTVIFAVMSDETRAVESEMERAIRNSGGACLSVPPGELYEDPAIAEWLYRLIRDDAVRYHLRAPGPAARESYTFAVDPSMAHIVVLGIWTDWGMQIAVEEEACWHTGRGDGECCGEGGEEAPEAWGHDEGGGAGRDAAAGGSRAIFQLYDASMMEIPATDTVGTNVLWDVAVDSAAAGEWTLTVSGGVPFSARVTAQSAVRLELTGRRGVAAGEEAVVKVRMVGAAVTTLDWALVAEDGRVYDEGLAMYDDGAHGDDGAGDGVWATTYAFPDSGSFRVMARWNENGYAYERVTASAIRVFGAPWLEFVEPDGVADSTGSYFWITWEDGGDLSAGIALYYDDDDTGADGILIAEGIQEDSPVDSLKWTVFGVPQGDYYVYAEIDDVVNPAVTVYSDHPVTITAGHQAGWPVATSGAVRASVVAVDLDADGSSLEVVAASYDSCVWVWDAAGEPRPGWPVRVAGRVNATPAVGNIDTTDGALEIVVGCWEATGALYCFHHDGSVVDGWPVYLGATIQSAPTVQDIDRDGALEVIVASGSQVHVYRGDGSVQSGWPQATDYGSVLYTSPAVADFDGDGYDEIAVCGGSTTMYLFAHTGAVKWTKTLQGSFVWAPLSAGDLDWDGVPEAIVQTWDTSASRVYAYRGDGTTPPGWATPKAVGTQARAGAAVGDLTGDGRLELVIGGGIDGNVYAYGSGGTPVSAAWGAGVHVGAKTYAPLVVADVDGDGTCEVVALVIDIDKMVLMDAAGVVDSAWCRGIDGDTYGAPCVADIDRDGDTEILFGTDAGTVYCFDLPGAYIPARQEYIQFQGDLGNTGRYAEVVPPVAPEVEGIEVVGPDSVRVWWRAVREDTLGRQEAVTRYRVYRGTEPFWVDGSVEAGGVAAPDTVFTERPGTVGDPNLSSFYRVTAEDQYGNESALSDETVGEFERSTGAAKGKEKAGATRR